MKILKNGDDNLGMIIDATKNLRTFLKIKNLNVDKFFENKGFFSP